MLPETITCLTPAEQPLNSSCVASHSTLHLDKKGGLAADTRKLSRYFLACTTRLCELDNKAERHMQTWQTADGGSPIPALAAAKH